MSDDDAWSVPAGHVRSRLTAAGGTLKLDGDRLIFEPTLMARTLKAADWSAHVSNVREITTSGISPLSMMAGGWRKRLAVELDNGDRELFSVARPGKVATELKGLVERPDAPPGP